MKKLTPAQAYALQVKADKRARVLEERANPELKADRQRVDAMFNTVVNKRSAKIVKAKKVSNRVAWTQPEVDFLIQQYIESVDLVNLTYNRGAIEAKFEGQFGSQHVNSVHLILCQIKHIDSYYPAEGMNSVSQLVRERAYAADPNRFPGGVTQEEKIGNAIDALLADIRA